jgi:hypothetical protein
LEALEEKVQAEIKSKYGWFMSLEQKFEIDRTVREKYAASVQAIKDKYSKKQELSESAKQQIIEL